MSDPLRPPMTADEVIAWAMGQPVGQRFELVAGDVVGMAPERTILTRIVREGTLHLDPPGLTVTGLFPQAA